MTSSKVEKLPRFPWYDSIWLSAYVEAQRIIRATRPAALDNFVEALSVLRAPENFQIEQLSNVVDSPTLKRIKDIIADLCDDEMEQREFFRFGRFILHDHPEFTDIQRTLVDTVSALAKEPVEISYNFLSLYNNLGVCKVHMDAPLAKWTLDLCIEQSQPWPIHFSQCVPWPEDFQLSEADWHSQIVSDPSLVFRSYAPSENEAILFAGSQQWHYRDRILQTADSNFCHLLFFHFIPAGCRELADPLQWHKVFDIPELAALNYAELQARQ